jgi:hypothetical protein
VPSPGAAAPPTGSCARWLTPLYSTSSSLVKAKTFAQAPVRARWRCRCGSAQLTRLQGGIIFRIKILNGRRVTE